jgi:hypothetical protein
MTGPRVYKAINAVASELARNGIAKSNTNLRERYQYRSIDDVLNRLSPLLAKHRLCILPRALERIVIERGEPRSSSCSVVTLKMAYDFVSALDASTHTIETFGEAEDEGDKATAKALSAAYKMAMFQTFCIPIEGLEDADASPWRSTRTELEPAPVQGWDRWVGDIKQMIATCASVEALERVQNRYRGQLTSLSRERPDLYRTIGSAFAAAKSLITDLKTSHSSIEDRAAAVDPATSKIEPVSLVNVGG